MKINLNETMDVVLTEVGAITLNLYHENMEGLIGRRVDSKVYKEGDTYRGQLWALISIFEGQIGLGLESPFEACEIFIEDRKNEG